VKVADAESIKNSWRTEQQKEKQEEKYGKSWSTTQ
jgi:hypothetical protein